MSEDTSSVLARIRWPRPFAGLRGVTLADVPREAMACLTLPLARFFAYRAGKERR